MCLTWLLFCCYREQSFPLSLVLSLLVILNPTKDHCFSYHMAGLLFPDYTSRIVNLVSAAVFALMCLFSLCLLKNKSEHEDPITPLRAVLPTLILFIRNISVLPRSTAGLVFCTTAQNCISLAPALPLGWSWRLASYGIAGAGTGGPRLGWKVVLGCGEGGRSPWAASAIQDFETEPFCLFTIPMEIFVNCFCRDDAPFSDCSFC